MTVMKKKTLAGIILSMACFAAVPFSATAQDANSGAVRYIDVYQDGSLFITYDEYLERQRRVNASRVTNQGSATLVIPQRRLPSAAQVARSSSTMELRDQWQIGAFR